MPVKKQIVVIGAAIFDLMGFPEIDLISFDSVPGRIETACGGVGRNIAENLHRLGLPPQLIAVFGNDLFSQILIQQAKRIGLNIDQSLFLNTGKGVSHLAAMNGENDMVHGIADLAALGTLSPDFFAKKIDLIKQADLVVLECNIPKESLTFLLETCAQETPFFLDPVSAPMAKKLDVSLGLVHTLKANSIEVESLLGLSVESEKELQEAAQYFLDLGIQQVVITLGEKGLFYADNSQMILKEINALKAVNTTGAGDAMMAGLVYSYLENWPLKKRLNFAACCSEIAVLNALPVSPDLNAENVLKRMIKE